MAKKPKRPKIETATCYVLRDGTKFVGQKYDAETKTHARGSFAQAKLFSGRPRMSAWVGCVVVPCRVVPLSETSKRSKKRTR